LDAEETAMRAYEYPVKVTSEGKLELPDALRDKLLPNQVVRIIVLINEPVDSEAKPDWPKLTAEQFLAGYSEADAAYDHL
jgi:hypothetical protein